MLEIKLPDKTNFIPIEDNDVADQIVFESGYVFTKNNTVIRSSFPDVDLIIKQNANKWNEHFYAFIWEAFCVDNYKQQGLDDMMTHHIDIMKKGKL